MSTLEHIKHWHDTQECKYLGCEIYEAIHNNLPLNELIEIVKDVDIDLLSIIESEHPADKDDRLYHEEQDEIAMEKSNE